MVTGGLGFVGAHVVQKLATDGAELVVLDDGSLGKVENLGAAADSVTTVTVDIRDGAGVTAAFSQYRPETVIHLAALHFIPACDADPKRCIDINVGGTQAVLDGCALAGVDSVVLASTAAVYAPDTTAHSEESRIGPTDIYGLTKLWSEQLGARFHGKSGIPVRIARLFNVFGPGETNPHLIPAIIKQAERSDSLRLGNLTTARDYIYTGDIAGGIAALSRLETDGVTTCNLGRGEAHDGYTVVRAIGEALGRPLEVLTDASRIRPSDRPVLLSDCTRAHEMLGWKAETTLVAGLTEAVRRPTAAGVQVD